MSSSSHPRRADAILIPRGFAGAGPVTRQHGVANAAFGPLCGCRSFWWSRQGEQSLGIPCTSFANYATDLADCSLYFATSHPLAGQPRHEWFLAGRGPDGRWRPEGLCGDPRAQDLAHLPKIGFKAADPAAGDPGVVRSAAEHREQQAEVRKAMLRTAMSTPELYERLKTRLKITSDDEMEALFGYCERIDAL